tara:strand:- start:431 stop:607 length:177 start_codon:yes stop_codon:yes gene_type:complete
MSYHDGYDPRWEGIAVVNPLIRIERKFNKIKKLLNNKKRIEKLSGIGVKKLIEEILNE